jgi:2-isopropylmalate synthase
VYSGVPASLVGRRQEIEVGPMSGESNVIFWLKSHGLEPTPERVKAVFEHAKRVDRVLTDQEIRSIVAVVVETRTS